MSYSFGAIARGDAASTVEHHAGMYLLASVGGRLATPALESVKSAFYRLTAGDAAAATVLCAAAPSMIADAVAVVLVVGEHAFVACAGAAVVVCQRGGATTRVTGTHVIAPGDDLVASTAALPVGTAFFATPSVEHPPPHTFRNDGSDAELVAAVAAGIPVGTVAIAALRSPR